LSVKKKGIGIQYHHLVVSRWFIMLFLKYALAAADLQEIAKI
jgi:hypothetical protein